MTGSEARRENNINLDFPRLAGQSGPVPGPMGLHKLSSALYMSVSAMH